MIIGKNTPFSINVGSIELAIIIFALLLVAGVCFMLLYLLFVNFQEHRKSLQKEYIEQFISTIVFWEGGEIAIPAKVSKMLRYSYFRQFITDELLRAKRDLSGITGDNLRHLYEQLALNEDSVDKLNSFLWHYKVQGIHELAIMEQGTELEQIHLLTTDRNEFVRKEAQIAVVKLSGFEGLRFLDAIPYSLSNWQQINLIAQLSGVPAMNFTGIEKWLQSSNESVVVFALKLSGMYQRLELRQTVAQCLVHPSMQVRMEAVKCFQHIYDETTAALLIQKYHQGNKQYQLTSLHVLFAIGGTTDVPFLLSQFKAEDHSIKLAAARILAKYHGFSLLEAFVNSGLTNNRRPFCEWLSPKESQTHSDVYPWYDIIQQIKSEQTT
ncbi:HEAT repeat domain-containing protein [Solitalea koreensis]|uniref:HEAT repeat-containing protein n=1 Tax=Solitalea koreensis TaxID=543615 RepID=A0A521BL60_9SPHI|nr:hypothetical protein [Solitalea koreensis]SMO47826.1 hypothetical protein SAMN06265350_102285 [Solitalea koreensis]